MPCGTGDEAGIAIVAPPPCLVAHDEGMVTLGPRGVSFEHQRKILASRGGSQHALCTVEATSPTTPKIAGKLGGRFEATCGQT